MDLIQIFSPECKSKSISGGFIHQAGIFGVKCFSIFYGLILADSKSGEILMPNDLQREVYLNKHCRYPMSTSENVRIYVVFGYIRNFYR